MTSKIFSIYKKQKESNGKEGEKNREKDTVPHDLLGTILEF